VSAAGVLYPAGLPSFRTRLFVCLFCVPGMCATSLVSVPGFAQTPGSTNEGSAHEGAASPDSANQGSVSEANVKATDVNDEARTSFASGMEAFQQGRFRAAVEYFKEADRLAPSARLSFNIALTYERMADAPNALAAYRDYLRRSPRAENARETSVRVSELELELQKSGVQQLSVLSTPPGATVLIDDIARGMTPWTGEMPPGPHRLTLRARGYEDVRQDFDLSPRHSSDLVYQLRAAQTHVPTYLPPIAQASPSAEPGPSVAWWTWAAFGGSAALLVGSGAFELSRRHLEKQAPREQVQIPAGGAYDTMTSRKHVARVLLGSGAALGVVGGVSLYLDLTRRGSHDTSVGLACDGMDCQAVARGYW
jgi:hypothetical protein